MIRIHPSMRLILTMTSIAVWMVGCDEPIPNPASLFPPSSALVAPDWAKVTPDHLPPFQSDLLTPFGEENPQTFTITAPPVAFSDVIFRFKASADLAGGNQFVRVFGNNGLLATIYETGPDLNCGNPPADAFFKMTAAEFNAMLNLNGNLRIDLIPSSSVRDDECEPFPYIIVRVEYCSIDDCNGNGTPDNCEIEAGDADDENGNGIPDDCDLMIHTVTPASGPIDGGTIVTIEGAGFGPGTAVKFGAKAAAGINVINSGLLTAIAPPHEEGDVDIYISTTEGATLNVMLPAAYAYFFLPEEDGTDSDGDGLTDVEERAGYQITVDLYGFGPGNNGGNLVRRTVFSDPKKRDTDGDGLEDGVEWVLGSDARSTDTDGDGLDDHREVSKELTSPVSVDTDSDARGPDGTLPPNASLFDGAELEMVFSDDGKLFYGGTSPLLDDTDGDGVTDYDEFANPIRSPLVSDMPQVKVDFVGELQMTLDISLASGTSVTDGQQYGLTESQASTTTNSNETSWENTLEFTQSLEISAGAAAGAAAGPSFEATVGASAMQGFTEGGSTSWSEASTEETQNSYLQIREESVTEQQTINGGTISAGIRIINESNVALTMSDLLLSALMIDPTARDGFRPLTVLQPALNNVTLPAFDQTGVLVVQSDVGSIGAQQIIELMKDPSALIIDVSTFDLEDNDGRSFAFLNDVTNARTATVVVDFGVDRKIERYRVATEVGRNVDGTASGISMGDVMTTLLRMPFETTVRSGSTNPDYPNGVEVLTKVRDRELTLDGNTGEARAFWAVYGTFEDAGDNTVNFEDIILKASDTIFLVYTQDLDDDGVFQREEFMYGSSDQDTDSDNDTLDDFFEIRTGWDIFVLGNNPQLSGLKHVFPDPTRENVDQDGLSDAQEFAALTDPKNPDTDGDGLIDGTDNCPLNPVNIGPDFDLTDSADPSGSMVTVTGRIFEELAPVNPSNRCDVDAIQRIEIDWGDGNTECYDLADPGCTDLLTADLENDLESTSVQVSFSHTYLTQNVTMYRITATDVRGESTFVDYPVNITFPISGMVAYYPMNDAESVDVIVSDQSGENRHGCLATNGTWESDEVNRFSNSPGALCLNQDHVIDSVSNTAGVSLAPMPVPGSAGGFTVAAWMIPESQNDRGLLVGQPGYAGLFVDDGCSDGACFTIRASDGSFHTLSPSGLTITPQPGGDFGCPNAAVPANWQLFVAVVEPIGPDFHLKLYHGDYANFGVPGMSNVTMVDDMIVQGATFPNPNAAIEWQIAGQHNSFGPVQAVNDSSASAFQGRIDDVRIYDRALAAIEVNALFNEADNSGVPGNDPVPGDGNPSGCD